MATLEETVICFLKEHGLKDIPHEGLSKDTLETIYAFAYGFYESGNYAKASRFFQFLTEYDPNNGKYWKGLGAAYQMLKSQEKAVKCYAQAALLDENDPYPHWHAAECFWALKNTELTSQALNSSEATAKRNPKRFHALLEKLQLLKSFDKKKKTITNK